MPRYAIISDVHGNLHALRAVLTRIEELGVDRIICLGDVVGYGPHPAECLRLIARHAHHFILGNHEEAVLDPRIANRFNGTAREAIHWTRRNLDPACMSFIRRFRELEYVGLDRDIICVHDCPVPGPTDYLHDRQMAALAFRGVDAPICLVGHTHVPAVFGTVEPDPDITLTAPNVILHRPTPQQTVIIEPGMRAICNPGAVGQPRDSDPRASFAILERRESDAAEARYRFTVDRVAYDIAAAQAATEAAGLPTVLSERLAVGA